MGRGSAPPMAGNGPTLSGSSSEVSASKGSPAGTTTGVCWTSTSKGTFGSGSKQFTQRRGLPSGSGRDQKTPDGRSSDRILFYKDALRRPPVFPQCKQWPDANEGVARGKHTRFFDMMDTDLQESGCRCEHSSVQSVSARYGGYGLVLPVCRRAQAVETRRSLQLRDGLPGHHWR